MKEAGATTLVHRYDAGAVRENLRFFNKKSIIEWGQVSGADE